MDDDGRFLFAKEPLYFEGDVYADLLRECFIASGSNVMIRRRCVNSVGPFDVNLPSAEDWEYWLRVAARWPFVVVPRYQILYRPRPIAVGLLTSALGEGLGYALGIGDASRSLGNYEFHRERHLRGRAPRP